MIIVRATSEDEHNKIIDTAIARGHCAIPTLMGGSVAVVEDHSVAIAFFGKLVAYLSVFTNESLAVFAGKDEKGRPCVCAGPNDEIVLYGADPGQVTVDLRTTLGTSEETLQ